ncbi:serine/threonine protein phosphatase [Mucilaginibacter hurinus]|uniref:Serine/threonine protein phosphatase n=1 Tax=Mucilaginibacter hurinus TaxID=2201324 RepID=A0A367GKP5_9SPHI|nr:metallophosphoesterase family protein [Mucilaginibacter hurinus]RCH54039.1 serine/threonine protein phosphatase [Mucilaginibacter hurinus]
MTDVINYPSPEAEQATVIYAIGDIHGQLELLLKMEEQVKSDIEVTKPAHPVVCYLGDYIDRGPHSAGVIEYLQTATHKDGITRVFLKGNHEDRLIDFMADPEPYGASMLKYGGLELIQSYGLFVTEERDYNWHQLKDEFEKAIPASHHAFLRNLRPVFKWRNYLFVHAGLNPENPPEAQQTRDLMWIRDPFLESNKNWGFRVVHGHVIVPEPEFKPNRIDIDTGAFKNGVLSCLVVSENGLRVLQSRM